MTFQHRKFIIQIFLAMNDRFKNKYRIKSARLEGYDYSQSGLYFITICTHGVNHYFGEIINGNMQLSEIGKIAHSEWYKTLELRPDMNLQLGEFVVMPNHIHGIIAIGVNEYNIDAQPRRDAMHRISTTPDTLNENPLNEYKNKFAPQLKNISSIIRGYKSPVTKQAHNLECEFRWQTRFYDHVIISDKSLDRISEYIINNVDNWKEDKFNEY